MLKQVGTRVIPQIKKYGLWREREKSEKKEKLARDYSNRWCVLVVFKISFLI